MLRGRKTAADAVTVQGVGEEELWAAAQAAEGFSGAWVGGDEWVRGCVC